MVQQFYLTNFVQREVDPWIDARRASALVAAGELSLSRLVIPVNVTTCMRLQQPVLYAV